MRWRCRADGQSGAVTAELAVAVPAVLLVLAALPFAWSARRHPSALATVGVLAAGGLAVARALDDEEVAR